MAMDKSSMMFPGRGERKNSVLYAVMFIDPGFEGTGLAFFPAVDCGKNKKTDGPSFTEVIRAPKNEKWDNAQWSICASVRGAMVGCGVKDVVIELPELWAGSAVSMASASKGDLFKLCLLVGGLCQIAREHTGNLPILVTPQEWKGQLPKDVVLKRVEKAFNKTFRNHEGDAVGMGLSAQGGL